MSKRCRKCKGTGVISDLSWCGKDCCPRDMKCLVCAGTGRVE